MSNDFYVGSVNWSGVAGPFTEAEAEAYAEAKHGFVASAAEVDPEIRAELAARKEAR